MFSIILNFFFFCRINFTIEKLLDIQLWMCFLLKKINLIWGRGFKWDQNKLPIFLIMHYHYSESSNQTFVKVIHVLHVALIQKLNSLNSRGLHENISPLSAVEIWWWIDGDRIVDYHCQCDNMVMVRYKTYVIVRLYAYFFKYYIIILGNIKHILWKCEDNVKSEIILYSNMYLDFFLSVFH